MSSSYYGEAISASNQPPNSSAASGWNYQQPHHHHYHPHYYNPYFAAAASASSFVQQPQIQQQPHAPEASAEAAVKNNTDNFCEADANTESSSRSPQPQLGPAMASAASIYEQSEIARRMACEAALYEGMYSGGQKTASPGPISASGSNPTASASSYYPWMKNYSGKSVVIR